MILTIRIFYMDRGDVERQKTVLQRSLSQGHVLGCNTLVKSSDRDVEWASADEEAGIS
jgi:hypothetical protein